MARSQAVAKKTTVKKAVAKKTTKKAVAQKTTAAGRMNASIEAAVEAAVEKERLAHERWKQNLLQDALDFAADQGYCEEVEEFLENQGFDVESMRKPVKFEVTMNVALDTGARSHRNLEVLRSELQAHLNSYLFGREVAQSLDVNEATIEVKSVAFDEWTNVG